MREERLRKEIRLLTLRFGQISFHRLSRGLLIYRFDLPPGWNRDFTRLLMIIPQAYPQIPPVKFYIDKGLRKYGKIPPHYFEASSPNLLCGEGFAWLCVHEIYHWKPSVDILKGDNLLTICNLIYNYLCEL
ncbi:hypothetical protein J7K43_01465 [Candidatus Calescamantes bacterium]|nr:hypothetical protein [Candidatus Calescamantes bacterium]